MNFTIRQATEKDIPVFLDLYKQAVDWLNSTGQPMWSYETVSWENLSKSYRVEEFFIGYVDDTPACCMALPSFDPNYWDDIPPANSLFVHKVTVSRPFAGQGLSYKLLDFAVERTRSLGYKTLRIDARVLRPKLRKLYEDYGFTFVRTAMIDNSFEVALYVLEV